MKHIKKVSSAHCCNSNIRNLFCCRGGFKFGNKYAFIFNKDNPDTFLSHKHYKYSYYTSDTTIYFIVLKGHFAEITNYEVKNNEQINISLKPEDKLIISFPNRGTPWRYIIDNLNDIDILKFRYCTMIHTANISTDGSIHERQNLYLDMIKPGEQIMNIKLMDSQGITTADPDFDQINIEVTVICPDF